MNINQSGRSMVEMLGVLAIIGVLSVGAIAGYSTAMNKYKSGKTIQQISGIIANMKTIYYGQKYFNAKNSDISWAGKHDFTQEAAQVGIFSDIQKKKKKNGALTIKNPFNGTYEVARTIAASENSFSLMVFSIPKEICIDLATADWGTLNTTGYIGIAIGKEISGFNKTRFQACLAHAINAKASCWNNYNHCTAGGGNSVCGRSFSPTEALEYCNCKGNNCAFGVVFQ